ncbi:septation protein SepH [Saccharopolyspora rosea]|uniref:Septation protein SepH n=1 Tax=Saccharopolyspora rosea TaxID=524884 RepID=A0ABW3FQ34_9PSEU|nr:septation protein SepH [Saccharopolyspora rosea]
MRALRVVGLDEDGESVICEDPENGERFTVPADERLRAAARGDLTRLGQVQIEMEAQMRPREIQARIRSGATVEQIAAAAGIPEHRVERYAYPVLLERNQIAEMAQRAHPVREDGPDVQTLGEVVAHTFGMRGHEYSEAEWDAWRGEDGKWVVQLVWQAGRSENRAHWVFHPGAHGGTIAALDDHAADLLDPSPNRPLRTVRPVTELAREALQLDQQESAVTEAAAEPVEPTAAAPQEAAAGPDLDTGPPPPPVPPVERPAETAPQAEEPAEDGGEVDDEPEQQADGRRGRKNHPIVPSWEDVLLGVRSHR